MERIRLAKKGLLKELEEKDDRQLSIMLAAVSAAEDRQGNFNHLFEIESINYGLDLARKHGLK